MKSTSILSVLCALGVSCLSSCAGNSSTADRASNFAATPSGRLLTDALITVAATAADQYATTRKIDKSVLIAATLDGAAESLRSLAGTPRAQSPKAVASATTTGAGLRVFDNTVSVVVAATVDRQIQNGTPPDQAIENVATAMNAAAAKTRLAGAGP